ncbi:MAG: glycogen-binding domain-containing protein [Chitinophagaceae bacterium]|nr:glycogen-binding domain-containing protein [Chitinophagaceae bacterium]
MKMCKLFFALILFLPFVNVWAQVAAVSITVHVPHYGTNDQGVFIAGSFNGWQAGDSLYKMNKVDDKTYTIILPLFENRLYQYKYTLGKWDKVEVALNDSDIQNRRFMSMNGKSIADTVSKWKQPGKAEKPVVSPQMQQINAMKDSTAAKLQTELTGMLDLLKPYIRNLLQENPSKRVNKRINKKAKKKIGKAYDQLAGLFWNVFASIRPEQKQAILKALDSPAANKDFINAFLKAFNETMEEKKPVK